MLALTIASAASSTSAWGAGEAQKPSSPSRAPRAPSGRMGRLELQGELVERMKASRESLEQLLAAYEEQLRGRIAELARRRKLYEDGEISKSFLNDAEREVAGLRSHIAEVQQWIAEDDFALQEAVAREEILRGPSLAPGGYAESQTLIRFNGAAQWSLADAGKIEKFFLGRFGHTLPVSAMGQTSAHERMRFDHHNAMDVAVLPDSDEGRALMAYLRQAGIPFMAFRRKMSGAATGAHIHIGKPSLRLASP